MDQFQERRSESVRAPGNRGDVMKKSSHRNLFTVCNGIYETAIFN
jgi:hypothetical protein